MSLSEIGSACVLVLIKCIILLYDISTFIIYCLIQRPWNKDVQKSGPRSKRENPGDRNSAYIAPNHDASYNTQSLVYGCSSMVELMQRIVMRYKDKRCLGYRELMMEEDEVSLNGSSVTRKIMSQNFKWLNYAQVDKRIDDTMRGLVGQGLKSGDRVIFLMENRIEYLLTMHACIRMAAIPALVPAASSSQTISDIVFQSTPVCLVTSCKYSSHVLQSNVNLSGVKLIICAEDKGKEVPRSNSESVKIAQLSDIVRQGSEARPDVHRVASKLTDLALVVYKASSSDSTTAPAGIMITHRNLMTAVHSLDSLASATVLKSVNTSSAYPACLPLTCMSELVMQHVLLMNGMAIGYSNPDSLTSQAPGCLKASKADISLLKPQLMSCSVRELDLLRQHVQRHLITRSLVVRDFFNFCLDYKYYWINQGFDTPIMNMLVFDSIKSELGERIRTVFVGIQESEILSPSTESFAQAVTSSSILTGFCINEATGFMTLRTLDDKLRIGSSGALMPGVKLKLVDWPEGDCYSYDHPFPRGEIWITGPMITRGYYMNPAETGKMLEKDENGTTWFKTGCIGEIDERGNVRIIDKKENMIKMELSSRVSSLGQAESIIRSCYYVDNVCLIADENNSFIIALVSPDKASISRLCGKLDIEEGSLDFKEMCMDPEIQAEVTKSIVAHGVAGGLSKKMLPSKVKLCHETWDPESGLVDSDMKPLIGSMRNKYNKEISRMFGIIDASRGARPAVENNNSDGIPDQNHVPVLQVASTTTVPIVHQVLTETEEGMEMQEKKNDEEKRHSSSPSIASTIENEAFMTPRESVTSVPV